jgi:hypothetical protein
MPAYRSEAEAEVREAVVARLRALRPDARIMHEVNASSFGNRIDVLAVSPAEIIAVEIKSAKDKLDRLPEQMKAMRRCSHFALAVLHEKFLLEKEVSFPGNADFERDGKLFAWVSPAEHRDVPRDSLWIYPEASRGRHNLGAWREPQQAVCKPLPPSAIDILWRGELAEMAARHGIAGMKSATMERLINALRWNLTGCDLTKGICAALRSRVVVEGDAPIAMAEAA